MKIELDEKELVKIIRAYCMGNLSTGITSDNEIRIASKSYQSLAAVVTIEPAADAGKEGE